MRRFPLLANDTGLTPLHLFNRWP